MCGCGCLFVELFGEFRKLFVELWCGVPQASDTVLVSLNRTHHRSGRPGHTECRDERVANGVEVGAFFFFFDEIVPRTQSCHQPLPSTAALAFAGILHSIYFSFFFRWACICTVDAYSIADMVASSFRALTGHITFRASFVLINQNPVLPNPSFTDLPPVLLRSRDGSVCSRPGRYSSFPPGRRTALKT